MRGRKPGIRLEVDLTVGHARVQSTRLVLLGVDLETALLQHLLPQESGGDALVPRDVADVDLAALAHVAGVGLGLVVRGAEGAHAARDQGEDDDADHGDGGLRPVAPDLLAAGGGGAGLGDGTAADRRDLLAQAAGEAVQVDGEDHDGDAGFEAEADVQLADALVDRAAEAGGADHARDDDHRQAEHDDLVDTGHDRGERQRQLHPQQGVARRRTEGFGRLHQILVDLADAQFGHPDARGHREDDGGDDAGGGAESEEDDGRQQVDHAGHGLHEVQDRSQHRAHRAGAGRPYAERHGQHDRDQGGDQHQRQRGHRVVPQLHRDDEAESDEAQGAGQQAAQPPGDDGEDAGEQQRLGGGEDRVDAGVQALDDSADRVEEPGEVVLEPVDTGVDPLTEGQPRHGRSPCPRPRRRRHAAPRGTSARRAPRGAARAARHRPACRRRR